jgi:hypothetical protein
MLELWNDGFKKNKTQFHAAYQEDDRKKTL